MMSQISPSMALIAFVFAVSAFAQDTFKLEDDKRGLDDGLVSGRFLAMADVSGEVGTPMFSREDRGNDFRPLQFGKRATGAVFRPLQFGKKRSQQFRPLQFGKRGVGGDGGAAAYRRWLGGLAAARIAVPPHSVAIYSRGMRAGGRDFGSHATEELIL